MAGDLPSWHSLRSNGMHTSENSGRFCCPSSATIRNTERARGMCTVYYVYRRIFTLASRNTVPTSLRSTACGRQELTRLSTLSRAFSQSCRTCPFRRRRRHRRHQSPGGPWPRAMYPPPSPARRAKLSAPMYRVSVRIPERAQRPLDTRTKFKAHARFLAAQLQTRLLATRL